MAQSAPSLVVKVNWRKRWGGTVHRFHLKMAFTTARKNARNVEFCSKLIVTHLEPIGNSYFPGVPIPRIAVQFCYWKLSTFDLQILAKHQCWLPYYMPWSFITINGKLDLDLEPCISAPDRHSNMNISRANWWIISIWISVHTNLDVAFVHLIWVHAGTSIHDSKNGHQFPENKAP